MDKKILPVAGKQGWRPLPRPLKKPALTDTASGTGEAASSIIEIMTVLGRKPRKGEHDENP